MKAPGVAVLWRIKFGLATLFCWSAMVMFGGLLVETVLLYPNIFHDVPASLERSSEFMVASNPGSYFPQLGTITLGSAMLAIVATWRQPFVRYTFLGGFLSIALGDFVLSMLAMWERNTIMFEEGLTKHSAEYLQQVAADFQVAHWFRVAAAGLAAALVFVGLLRLHREWLSTTR